MKSWGKYPPELPSINLDVDWIYRKLGSGMLVFGEIFWNGLNDLAHACFVAGLTDRICFFLKQGHVYTMKILYQPFSKVGLIEKPELTGEAHFAKRTALGLHPIGWTALFCMVFFLGFLALVFN